MTTTSDICTLSAVDLARLIRVKELSARDVVGAHLAQIERVNPRVNAIVTLLADRAMDRACAADEALARGEDVGPLHVMSLAGLRAMRAPPGRRLADAAHRPGPAPSRRRSACLPTLDR